MSQYTINDYNIHDLYKSTLNEDSICRFGKRFNLGYSVLTYSVKGDINVGKIMRSAELLGCQHFVIYGCKQYDRRYTQGSQNYLNTIRCRMDEMSFDEIVAKLDVTPVFVEQGGETYHDPIRFFKVRETPKPPLFVFGNESEGIPGEILSLKEKYEGSYVLSLPSVGILRSYNVSVTSGIVLNDYYRYLMDRCCLKYL